MLNRHHLTLSALSNRLNLGTRSLVLTTGVNNGGATLRIRASHTVSMRAFKAMWSAPSIPMEACAAAPITSPASAFWACLKACSEASKPGDSDPSRVPSPSWRSWRDRRSTTDYGLGRRRSSRSRQVIERTGAARAARQSAARSVANAALVG